MTYRLAEMRRYGSGTEARNARDPPGLRAGRPPPKKPPRPI